jgi:hypothetical protein
MSKVDALMRELNTLITTLNVRNDEKLRKLLDEVEAAAALDAAGRLDLWLRMLSFLNEAQSIAIHGLEAIAAYEQLLAQEAADSPKVGTVT